MKILVVNCQKSVVQEIKKTLKLSGLIMAFKGMNQIEAETLTWDEFLEVRAANDISDFVYNSHLDLDIVYKLKRFDAIDLIIIEG